MPGYMGKILDIDLASRKVTTQELPSELVAKFIGGTGFGSKIIYDQVGLDADPLGPENIVVFTTGPLTGTGAPASGRLEIAAKSPLNGLLGLSNSGGGWVMGLKRAGYDALIVRNVSAKPVYIWINNDQVEIREAQDLWGKDTWETTQVLKKELGERSTKEVKVVAIGPAGENLVRFAGIMDEFYHAAGRCGIGAVMGSKRLKAVAVRGNKRVAVARPEEFRHAVKETLYRLDNPGYPVDKVAQEEFRRLRSLYVSRQRYNKGCLSGKNFQTGILPGWLENNTLEVAQKYITREFASCPACPRPCFHLGEVNEGKYAGLKMASATFVASIIEFGSKCAITNIPAIWKCKEVCHRLGLDMFSAASAVSFAMELYQRGIITSKDTGGLALEWGSDDATLEMLAQIAYRRGLGDVLAEGSVRAAQKIGQGAQKYALNIKGTELHAPDPRAVSSRSWEMGCLDNPRGGDNVRNTHTQIIQAHPPEVLRKRFGLSPEEYSQKYVAALDMSEEDKKRIFGEPPRLDDYSYEGKAALTKWMGDMVTVCNCLGVCMTFSTNMLKIGPTQYAKLYSSATGIEMSREELLKAGERVFNLQRMYLIGRGISSKDDNWPDRFYDEPLPEGSAKGARLSRQEVEAYKQEYYQLRAWDKEGRPTKKKLAELGIP